MKQRIFVAGALAALIGLAGLACYLISNRQPALRVLCGSSMSFPIEAAKALFEVGQGPIAIDMGGSKMHLFALAGGEKVDVTFSGSDASV